MSLMIEGHGFITELDTSPTNIAISGDVCGHLGFIFADFTYSAEGFANVWVNGAQIGACLSPSGVTIGHDTGHHTQQADLVVDTIIARGPGSMSKAHWIEGFQGRFLTFAPEAIERFFHMPLSRIAFKHRDIVVPATDQPVMSHLLAAVAFDLSSGNPGGPILLETLSAAALRSIVELPSDLKKPLRGLTGHQARTLRSLIVERSAEPLSLVDLADAVDLSVGHMLRAFKITFGVTPHQYIMRERVDCATAFLKTTAMTLDEIAVESGFGSKGQMARTFRMTLGVAPKDIRNGQTCSAK